AHRRLPSFPTRRSSDLASMAPELARALGVTALTWVGGAVVAVALGFLVALGRRYGPRALNAVLAAYVELIRGTPFLIQLFLLYRSEEHTSELQSRENLV